MGTYPTVTQIENNQRYFEALAGVSLWGFGKKQVCYLCEQPAERTIIVKDRKGEIMHIADECFKEVGKYFTNMFRTQELEEVFKVSQMYRNYLTTIKQGQLFYAPDCLLDLALKTQVFNQEVYECYKEIRDNHLLFTREIKWIQDANKMLLSRWL